MKKDLPCPELLKFFEDSFQNFIDQKYPLDSSELNKAINYALKGQGKRVRPMLTFLTNEALGGSRKESALAPAIAIEMMHTYSLVHDDMPILDDDDLRRGRKTVHVVFDEPTALLVGNSILTDLFMLTSDPSSDLSDKQKNQLTFELAQASGSQGMAYGQALDLFWTEKQGFTVKDLDQIHLNKTGKLLGCSCALGAIVADANESTIQAFRKFGELVGHSFQIIDDLLDQSTETGKSTGKDIEQGKLTYLRLYNRNQAKALAEAKIAEAFNLLEGHPALVNPTALFSYVRALLTRNF